MFHRFFSRLYYKCVYLNVIYVFTYDASVFIWDVVYVYNGFKCFSGVFASVFRCMFYLFSDYVAIVTSECFKTRSGVASLLSHFYCLASVSAVGCKCTWRSMRDVGRQAWEEEGGR
jgi:hypothetical protein